MLVKVDEGFNKNLVMVVQCLQHIRHYMIRNEGKRFRKDDWIAVIQWINAANKALGESMGALDPDYFTKAMDKLEEDFKKAYKID
jgi:hypothetical protein